MTTQSILILAVCMGLSAASVAQNTPPEIVGPGARSGDSAWTDGAIILPGDHKSPPSFTKFKDRPELSVVLDEMEQAIETWQPYPMAYGLAIIYESLNDAQSICVQDADVEAVSDLYIEIAGQEDIGVCIASKCGPPTLEGLKKIKEVISTFGAAHPGQNQDWTIIWGECAVQAEESTP